MIRRRPSVNHSRRASSHGRFGAVAQNASFPVTLGRAEIWRHLRRRSRTHSQRRGPGQASGRGRATRWRSSFRRWPAATNQLVGWVHGLDAAGYDTAEYDQVVASGEQVTVGLLAIALQTIGVPAQLLPGLAGRLHDRCRLRQGPDPGDRPGAGARLPRCRQGRRGRGLPGPEPGAAGDDARAAAARTPRRWRWRRRSGPSVATSSPMSTVSTPAIPGSSPRPASSTASPTRRCWRWPRSGPRCCRPARWRWRCSIMSGCRCCRASRTCRVRWSWMRMRSWKARSSAGSPTAGTRRASPCWASRTARASPPPSSARCPSNGINVDMIVQSVSRDGVYANLTFTVSRADLPRALAVLERANGEIGYERVVADADVCKVSVVGVGMRCHAGIAHQMFATLAAKGINIQAICHLGDQGQRADRRGIHRAGAAGAAYGLRPGQGLMLNALSPARSRRRALAAWPATSSAASSPCMGGAMTWVSERQLVVGDQQCRRLRRAGLRLDGAGAAGRGDRGDRGAHRPAVRRQPDRHAPAARSSWPRSASTHRVGHVVLAGGLPPRETMERLKAGGAKVVCFAPSLALAKKLVRSGADALVIEGMEAGGHIGPVSTSVLAQEILPLRRPRCRCSSPAASAMAR